MKRTLCAMLVLVAASVSAVVFAGTPINSSELPETVQKFLAKHFPGDNIRKAEKDQGRRGAEYDVDLVSGAEIEFTSDGNWKEIKASRGAAVPAALVPEGIAKYVSENFSELSIVEIARKRGGYEVELSNDTELHLTEDGKMMQPRKGGNRQRR